MKTDLKVKYLQYLNEKKQDEGFTLIELLVVIIIIGILAAIALPSFLNQANKAKQSEAKQYVGSMNRTQQAYFLEQSSFTTEIGKLGLGIRTETENYSYTIVGNPSGVSNPTSATNQGVPIATKIATLKTYLGGVFTDTVTATSEATTIAILCESNQPNIQPTTVPAPTTAGQGTSCPANYGSLSK